MTRVTLKDVAKLADVNFTLVSKYINRTPGVSMRLETRQRIADAIRELDYHPISAARALRYGRSNVLGLVVGNLTNQYFAHYADSAINEAERLGFRLLLSVCKNGQPEAAIRGLHANQVDGIVCCDCFNPVDAPCPILTERSFSHESMQDAFNDSVRHLLQQGHSSIVGLFTDDRWPEIFATSWKTYKIDGSSEFLPANLAKRKEVLRQVCKRRPEAIFSTGWQTVGMLSTMLEQEFPGYDPCIILWANCKGPFLANRRIGGILHTSTLSSIKETFETLAEMIKKTNTVSRPKPIPCRFITRENGEYQKLITETFSLT